MPPRYAYWTIIAEGLPTAFRAAEREELMPTFQRLKEKHPDAEMKWFARGKLWASPEAARDAPRRGPARGPEWRPGGEHRDPREKFKKAKLKAWQRCLDGLLTGAGCDALRRDTAIATAEGRFVAQFSADRGPLFEDHRDDDQQNDRERRVRDVALLHLHEELRAVDRAHPLVGQHHVDLLAPEDHIHFDRRADRRGGKSVVRQHVDQHPRDFRIVLDKQDARSRFSLYRMNGRHRSTRSWHRPIFAAMNSAVSNRDMFSC